MFKYLGILFLATGLIQNVFSMDYDGWLNIKIDHALNCVDRTYCTRGNIYLKSIKSGTAVIDQTPLNKQHLEALQRLAEKDGFYTIRTVSTTSDNKGLNFVSSIKAKAFLDSGLTDVINTWVLPNGAVMAITFQATNSTRIKIKPNENEHEISTAFYLHHIDYAPLPDTASYIQKLEREREARDRGEVKDNRSFLVKYWMYIVPIAIFVMISGATNPEPAAQGSR